MVPFWGKQMVLRLVALVAVSSALLAVLWAINQGSGQASNGSSQARVSGPATADAEGSRPVEPGPGKARPTASSSVSQAEAVAIAEKSADGRMVNVARQGEGASTQFAIDVLRKDGKTTRVKLNATGRVIEKTDATPPVEEPLRTEPRGKEVRGTVQAVDATSRTLTIKPKEKGQRNYRLAPDARILSGSSAMPLADLQRGTRVRATLGDGDTIVELKVDRRRGDD